MNCFPGFLDDALLDIERSRRLIKHAVCYISIQSRHWQCNLKVGGHKLAWHCGGEGILALSIRMLAFHFLEAAFPASLSNSVGLTTWPLGIWSWPRWVRKVPMAVLQTTLILSGAWAALCTPKSTRPSDVCCIVVMMLIDSVTFSICDLFGEFFSLSQIPRPLHVSENGDLCHVVGSRISDLAVKGKCTNNAARNCWESRRTI